MAEPCPQTTQLHQWIERMRAGDKGARDELLRSVCHRLEYLARRMLKKFPNVGRWVDSWDVLQEALLRLLRSFDQLKPDSMRAFYSLAAQHIRWQLLDLARQLYGPEGIGANHQSHHLNGSGASSHSWDPADGSEPPEELEKWCRFHEEVEKLPVEQREVVSLIFYHGWTQAEVAELFQVTDRTIRSYWQHALLALRAALKSEVPV